MVFIRKIQYGYNRQNNKEKKIIILGEDTMSIVDVNHISKSYTGKTAVNDLSFTIEKGEIIGLIGPNGAGKSTTIKIMLNCIKPDSGDVRIFGRELTEDDKNHIGYLPEERGL